MELSELLKNLSIENFDYKNHEFVFIERLCNVCFDGVSSEKFDKLHNDAKNYLKENCCVGHDYSNIFVCKKCNIFIDIREMPNHKSRFIHVIVERKENINDFVQELLEDISGECYLSCDTQTIKNIIE